MTAVICVESDQLPTRESGSTSVDAQYDPPLVVEESLMRFALPISTMLRSGVCVLMFLCAAAAVAARVAFERDARVARQTLTSKVPLAKSLSGVATAVLVLPKMTNAGMGVGDQYGDGVLFCQGEVASFYNAIGASHGVKAGAQRFGYATFLMNDRAGGTLGTKTIAFDPGPGWMPVAR